MTQQSLIIFGHSPAKINPQPDATSISCFAVPLVMPRIKDAAGSTWFVEPEMVENKLNCQVPWWVWRVELDGSESVALSVGQNEVSLGNFKLSAHRDEPLRLLGIRPYEVSLISLWTFVVGLIVVLRFGIPSFLAAICLTLIPLCRTCPELPLLCRSWPRGRLNKGILAILKCCLFLWFVLMLLFWCKGQWRAAPSPGRAPTQGSPKEDTWHRTSRYEVNEPEDWIDPPEVVASSFIPEHISPCFLKDAKYEPLNMFGQGRTRVRSPTECQARCARERGCARFTALRVQPNVFWCHLQEYNSQLQMASGAIAGPGDCDQEAMLAEVLGQPRPMPVPVAPQTTTEAPPTKVPAPRPPIQRVSKVAAPVTPPPVPVAKEPPAQEVLQEEPPVPTAGPDLGADGSLPMLLLVLGIAGAVAFSGRLERS
eukprot:s313_g12.t1